MATEITTEQEELRSAVRTLVSEHATEDRVRAAMDSEAGFDERTWRLLADMGLVGLGVDEDEGGSGGSIVEVCIVMEELGGALACVPYLSSVVLAVSALRRAGDAETTARWLPGLLSGELRGAVAFTEDDGDWALERISTTAEPAGPDQWHLSGRKSYVIDGHAADLLLVVARAQEGPTLFAVEGDATGVTRRRLRTVDMTRPLATVDLREAPAVRVGEEGRALTVLSEVLDLARVALSAESVGGAQRVLSDAVDYAKLREQFGRPIGSFQAIKHACAEMLVQVELARSVAIHARRAADAQSPDLPSAAKIAKTLSADAFFRCAADNIQIHGGIGFTWEHSAHLYLRRAKSAQLLFGDAAFHRAQLASLMDHESRA
ncbi:hypothetical protein BL253_24915 [Pseudofrankia asymbiotica]|uniref:Acyl-CoA dehydrogenase n=1 Tax=Pseudofrankia asymbiotica TaxID=1834516 RepID=A0A1V2I5T8_9ACTN|nr:acyl-CoA dehydrogenase [Pseudofrankia asymbiotica]ONH26426.1 hypothetical protein BL253_24915 [Pseudofrankia asymbiotica]